jgi:hypothetical protein
MQPCIYFPAVGVCGCVLVLERLLLLLSALIVFVSEGEQTVLNRDEGLTEDGGGDLAAGLEGEVGGEGEFLEVEEDVEEAGVVDGGVEVAEDV